MSSVIILQLLNIIFSLGLFYALYKVYRRMVIQNTINTDNTISQVESILNFHRQLDSKPTVPSTRGWAASGDFLVHLIHIFEERSPENIIECSSGLSTLTLASAVARRGSGHVYSLEHDEFFVDKTRGLLKKHGLEKYATVIHAPLKELKLNGWHGTWYDFSQLPQDFKIDMLVVDGPPTSNSDCARYPAVPVLLDRLSAGAMIALDDADREEEQLAVKRWKDQYKNLKQRPFFHSEKGTAVLALE